MQIIVNGETIPSEVFQHELQAATQQNKDVPAEEIKQMTQTRIIEWTIIRQAASKEDIPVWGGEVDAEFDKLCQANGGKDAFFQRFGMTGKDEGRVKSDIELNLKTQRFLDLISKDAAQPSDEAVSEFYEQHKSNFIKPEQVHAMHIVKQPKNEQDAIIIERELRETRQNLLAGADFMETANAISDCTDHPADLGLFARGQMAPAFEFVTFSMNVGEISPVFQTQFGLHIATVLDKKPAAQMELEECTKSIRDRLLQSVRNDLIAEWVTANKADAQIEINEA